MSKQKGEVIHDRKNDVGYTKEDINQLIDEMDKTLQLSQSGSKYTGIRANRGGQRN